MIYVCTFKPAQEDIISGYGFISSREELDKTIVKKGKDIIKIQQDFFKEYFTPTTLKKYISDIKVINPYVEIEADVKLSDLSTYVDMLKGIKSREDLLYMLNKYPEEIIDAIKNVTNRSITANVEIATNASIVSTAKDTIDTLKEELDRLSNELKIAIEDKADAENKLSTVVSRINYQHGKSVDADKLYTVDSNSYDKIIYIKELTRVQYVDTLLSALKEILSIQYQIPVRLVVIEPYYSQGKELFYKGMSTSSNLSIADVVSSDILMFGLQPKLMEDILRNTKRISVCLVLDRCGYKYPHIIGDNVEVLYTLSDVKDIKLFDENIPKSRYITYSGSTLNVPYISDYENMSESERLRRYSELPIVHSIIDNLIRR